MQLRLALFTFLLAISLAIPVTSSTTPVSADRVWFCPGPGTLDYLRLFEHPEEWTRARAVVSVFKFYAQHSQPRAASIVGPYTFDALVRVGEFRILTTWKF
jgi:hypothetical protein